MNRLTSFYATLMLKKTSSQMKVEIIKDLKDNNLKIPWNLETTCIRGVSMTLILLAKL